VKARGADQMALQTRNVIKRLFAYAIARGKTRFNPAAAIEARFIATARSRDVALSQAEIGQFAARHLPVFHPPAVQAGAALAGAVHDPQRRADWWALGRDRLREGRMADSGGADEEGQAAPGAVVQTSRCDVRGIEGLASKSPWVLPSRNTLKEPIAHSTLNQAIRSLDLGVRDFVIHDFRRTASTQLHEAGFNSDWIEKGARARTEGRAGRLQQGRVPRAAPGNAAVVG